LTVETAAVGASAHAGRRRNPFKDRWSDPASLVVDAKDVRKSYRASAFSLDPLSVQVRIGEVTGVVGRNASGKTTLLRILMGDLAPDSGVVAFPGLAGGKRLWARIKREIAFIPQLPERWHGVLRHNLNFIAATHAPKGAAVKPFVDALVADYGMERYEYATWEEISGGFKIRFELVRALAARPKLLVLDEPLAHLDVVARERFLSDLKRIARASDNPIPILVTSQHLSEIEAIADQMILLDGGVCRYAGPLEGIAEQAPSRLIEVSLDADKDEALAALGGLGLERAEPTMEGFILAFPKQVDIAQVCQRLHAMFGARLTALRDITGSARGLMTGDAP
jgi:ABC-2 type transport system ATP-binding protein